MRIYTCISISISICICMRMCICLCIAICISTAIYIYTYVYLHVHVYVLVYIYKYMYMRLSLYTHHHQPSSSTKFDSTHQRSTISKQQCTINIACEDSEGFQFEDIIASIQADSGVKICLEILFSTDNRFMSACLWLYDELWRY